MTEIALLRHYFRPRFTLGALLILILLFAIPLGYVARLRSHNAARNAAWEKLASKGVRFHFEASILPGGSPSQVERSWWAKLTKATPTFRGIEVVEGYNNGQPPVNYITDEELRLLAHFPEIEQLHFSGVEHITDKGLGSLAKLPKLRSFHANCLARIDGKFLEEWAHAGSLEQLTFWNMAQLKGENLAPLEKLSKLKSLTLMSCVDLDKTPLERVILPPQLKELRIQDTPITDEALSRWLSQTLLRVLVLDTPFSRQIAPELRQQTELSVLSITNSPLIDEDLMFLGRCPALYNVSIVGAPVEGAFLKRIPSRTQLDFLTLRGVPLKDEFAAELKRLKKLVLLDLGWTPITGEFLQGAHWPALNSLDLWGTRFKEEGKSNLAAFQLETSGTIHFPANWSVVPMQYTGPRVGLEVAVLNRRFFTQNTAPNSNPIIEFQSPSFRAPSIDRCGAGVMESVQDRLRQAAAEEDELKRNPPTLLR